MTLKQAVYQSLEDINKITNYKEVYEHILHKNYYDFGTSKTPASTVSAILGDYVRNGDTRIGRIAKEGGTYIYYLTKNEHLIDPEILNGEKISDAFIAPASTKKSQYSERDLHILLSTYLNSIDINSRTIFHEQSNGKDSNQVWMHPDMVGINFLKLKTLSSQGLLKSINKLDSIKLYSFELKKSILNDTDLKKCYFQAVSNSSWANYGYLVAMEITESKALREEMERLNAAFGIGIIQLNAKVFDSKILFPAKHRDLDFKTIDKLAVINPKFDQFISELNSYLGAPDNYVGMSEAQIIKSSDTILASNEAIVKYCQEKNIPIDIEEE